MTKISTFNRSNLAQLRDGLAQALKTVGDEFGIVINVGSMSFSELETTARMTMTAVGDNVKEGESNTDAKSRLDFERHAASYNLKAEDFGKIIKVRGESYAIVGIKPRSPKYPVLCQSKVSGKTFKFTESSVCAALA
jgi:hypothetical protein